MRATRHLLTLALLSALAGCSLFVKDRSAERHDARRATAAPADDVVFLDVALVERPLGELFLDREVWDSGDEQGVELETKPALERNGLRVGQFGLLPDRLQKYIESAARAGNAPRRLRAEPDRPSPLSVGAVRPECSFALHLREGEPTPMSFQKAKCEFEVVPSTEDEGRVRLRFTPRLKHGSARMQTLVAKDPDGQLRWAVEPTEPTEEFAALRFELVVNAGEYVALGTWSDREGTLGREWFAPGGAQVQRLLVLRAVRVAPGDTSEASLSPLVPLAQQVGRPSARGSSR